MTRLFTLLVVVLGLLVAPTASADSLAEAKAAGLAGEQADGYVAARPGAPENIRELVGSVNVRRRAKYAQIAARNGTPLDAVSSLAGSKLIARTPSGQYIRNADGQWKKKP